MINIADVELNISKKLQPLRDKLEPYDISVTSLANDANMYYDSVEIGYVKYYLSNILGFQYDAGTLMQRINLTLTIAISCKKRYNDSNLSTEYDNLSSIVYEICHLLKRFIPQNYDDKNTNIDCCNSKIVNGFYPMYLTSYRLMPAKSGWWFAELTFTIPIEL